jgi:hypothetical protein
VKTVGRSILLGEVPREHVDQDMLAHIKNINSLIGDTTTTASFIRGLITGRTWVVFHSGKGPTKKFIKDAEAEELVAMQTVGGMQ